MIDLINDAFAGRDVADLLVDLDRAGVPAGEVRTLDRVYEWDQTRSQGLVLEVDHATLGTINLPGPPLRFDEHPPTGHRAPPTLGQHNASVRRWLDEVEPVGRLSGDWTGR